MIFSKPTSAYTSTSYCQLLSYLYLSTFSFSRAVVYTFYAQLAIMKVAKLSSSWRNKAEGERGKMEI